MGLAYHLAVLVAHCNAVGRICNPLHSHDHSVLLRWLHFPSHRPRVHLYNPDLLRSQCFNIQPGRLEQPYIASNARVQCKAVAETCCSAKALSPQTAFVQCLLPICYNVVQTPDTRSAVASLPEWETVR